MQPDARGGEFAVNGTETQACAKAHSYAETAVQSTNTHARKTQTHPKASTAIKKNQPEESQLEDSQLVERMHARNRRSGGHIVQMTDT